MRWLLCAGDGSKEKTTSVISKKNVPRENLSPLRFKLIRKTIKSAPRISEIIFGGRVTLVWSVVTRVFTFESLNPGVLPYRSLRLWIWISVCSNHCSTNTQSRPALPFSHPDLDCRTMLRCVCLDTVPHSSFEVQHCVRHTVGSDATEFPHCSQEVCSADVVVLHFKWQTCHHRNWDKDLACWIRELVFQRRLCNSSVLDS